MLATLRFLFANKGFIIRTNILKMSPTVQFASKNKPCVTIKPKRKKCIGQQQDTTKKNQNKEKQKKTNKQTKMKIKADVNAPVVQKLAELCAIVGSERPTQFYMDVLINNNYNVEQAVNWFFDNYVSSGNGGSSSSAVANVQMPPTTSKEPEVTAVEDITLTPTTPVQPQQQLPNKFVIDDDGLELGDEDDDDEEDEPTSATMTAVQKSKEEDAIRSNFTQFLESCKLPADIIQLLRYHQIEDLAILADLTSDDVYNLTDPKTGRPPIVGVARQILNCIAALKDEQATAKEEEVRKLMKPQKVAQAVQEQALKQVTKAFKKQVLVYDVNFIYNLFDACDNKEETLVKFFSESAKYAEHFIPYYALIELDNHSKRKGSDDIGQLAAKARFIHRAMVSCIDKLTIEKYDPNPSIQTMMYGTVDDLIVASIAVLQKSTTQKLYICTADKNFTLKVAPYCEAVFKSVDELMSYLDPLIAQAKGESFVKAYNQAQEVKKKQKKQTTKPAPAPAPVPAVNPVPKPTPATAPTVPKPAAAPAVNPVPKPAPAAAKQQQVTYTVFVKGCELETAQSAQNIITKLLSNKQGTPVPQLSFTNANLARLTVTSDHDYLRLLSLKHSTLVKKEAGSLQFDHQTSRYCYYAKNVRGIPKDKLAAEFCNYGTIVQLDVYEFLDMAYVAFESTKPLKKLPSKITIEKTQVYLDNSFDRCVCVQGLDQGYDKLKLKQKIINDTKKFVKNYCYVNCMENMAFVWCYDLRVLNYLASRDFKLQGSNKTHKVTTVTPIFVHFFKMSKGNNSGPFTEQQGETMFTNYMGPFSSSVVDPNTGVMCFFVEKAREMLYYAFKDPQQGYVMMVCPNSLPKMFLFNANKNFDMNEIQQDKTIAAKAVKIQIYKDLHLAVVEFQSVSDMKDFQGNQLMIKDTKLAIVKFPPK